MKFAALALTLLMFSIPALAYEGGDMFLDPHVAVGYNVAQGTYFLVGVDAGYAITDQLAAGVGGFYQAGKRPEHDRAIGGGPFVTYYQPLASFLVASVREDLDYIDQRAPVLTTHTDGTESYSHENQFGTASITSVGLHVRVSRNLGLSAGYRVVLALSNTDIGKDRSGTFLGISIGF